ncbi:hypothetical protein VZT92_008732 [Zoarces viviparus]|uniref:Uncharacterized protein n=1 Tax=Zoarces viviparus TaxID=48416 RepID=A0AAW1FGH7_ZOAVI
MIQGGFLEAQTALTQQANRHRRAHLRHAREQRRHKAVYSVNEGFQRLKLVRRPTERDIFWDETTGQSLDPSELLVPETERKDSLETKDLSRRTEREVVRKDDG